jgi:hypothetical protein
MNVGTFLSSVVFSTAAALTAVVGAASGHDSHSNRGTGPFLTAPLVHSTQLSDAAPPLWDGLGSLHYPVTTAVPQAQQYFDQGLRLTYAFNDAEARLRVRKPSSSMSESGAIDGRSSLRSPRDY